MYELSSFCFSTSSLVNSSKSLPPPLPATDECSPLPPPLFTGCILFECIVWTMSSLFSS